MISPPAVKSLAPSAARCRIVAMTATLPPRSLSQRRARRVALLLTGIVLLSLADLVITLVFLRSTGMMEANPLAALVIRSTGSSWSLACFKILTVTVCVALLFKLRLKLASEIAAWCGLAVLAFMSLQWHQYASHVDGVQGAMLATGSAAGEEWLILE
jgi:hypothetical protein